MTNEWTYEMLAAEALKYRTKTEFCKKRPDIFYQCRKLDIFQHLVGNNKWDKDSLKKEALKYETKSEFKKNIKAHQQLVIKKNGLMKFVAI